MSDIGFHSRLIRYNRSKLRLERGYKSKVTKDGLIVFKPAKTKRELPLKGLMMIAAVVFAFKGMSMVYLGAADYMAQVTALQSGTVFEKIAGFVMMPDPVSRVFAIFLAPFLG